MTDDDVPQLTIVTRFETDGSGADEAVADLDKIKDSAADAGEGINNSLDNGRAVTHALRGLMELRERGVMALAGLASEGFVVTEAFEAMLGPLAPILMTLTLIASIGIPMFERMTGASKESKTAEEDLGKASEEAGKKRIDAIDAVISKRGEEIKAEVQLNEELEKEAGYAQKEFEDTEKLITARTKLAVAELELQRQVALGSAETKEEVDAINERYKNLIAGAKNQGDADVLDTKINASAQDIADKEGERRRAQDDLSPLEDQLQQQRDATQQAQDAAAALGVMPGPTGSYADVAKELGKQLDELIRLSKADPRNQRLKDQIDDVGKQQVAANNANDATQTLAKLGETLNPTIDKLSAQVQSLSSAIDAARADNQILQLEQQTALAGAKTASLADQQEASRAAAKAEFEEFKATLGNQIKDAETKSGAAGTSEDEKAALKAQIDGLQAQIADYQLKHSGPNELNLSDAERTTLRGDVRADQGNAANAIGAAQVKEQKQQQKADQADDRDTGTEALGDIKSLGGSKQQIDAAKAAVDDLRGGNESGVEQLISIFNQLSGTARNQGEVQFRLFQTMLSRLSALEGEMRATTDRLAHANNVS